MSDGPRIGGRKLDEVVLWTLFGPGGPFEWPREAGAAIGMHHKRVIYLCNKWFEQGIYGSGTSDDLGWKEDSPYLRSGKDFNAWFLLDTFYHYNGMYDIDD